MLTNSISFATWDVYFSVFSGIRNVTEHSETFSELVTRSEIDFKFSVNSDFMILFQCFCFFRGKLSLEYFSFDSFDVSAFEFGSMT